jgi:hypothetical protein
MRCLSGVIRKRSSSHEHYSSSHSKTLRAAVGCSVWFANSGRIKDRIERLTGQHCATRGKSQRKTCRISSAGNSFCDWLSRPRFRKKPAIEDAQRILAEHIEPGFHRNPETTINMPLSLLDRRELRSDGSALGTGCAS